MSIPVLHVITAETDKPQSVNTEVYKRGVGEPPKYHVWCTCQWEGWTHDQRMAINFVMSHRHAQIVRGNVVEIKVPDEWNYSAGGGVAKPAGAETEKIVISTKPETPFHPNGNPNNVDVTKHMQLPKRDNVYKEMLALTPEQKALIDKERSDER